MKLWGILWTLPDLAPNSRRLYLVNSLSEDTHNTLTRQPLQLVASCSSEPAESSADAVFRDCSSACHRIIAPKIKSDWKVGLDQAFWKTSHDHVCLVAPRNFCETLWDVLQLPGESSDYQVLDYHFETSSWSLPEERAWE